MTSFDGAQAIVKAGDANPSDFWLFCGLCGWETSSFYEEMHDEGLWRIVSSDGDTILEELNLQRCEEDLLSVDEVCDVDSDSRNAGIHTWEMLMDMIGRGTEAKASDDSFGDLMLKEWATGALSFVFDERQRMSSNMISEVSTISLDQEDQDFDVSLYDPASSMTMGTEILQQSAKNAAGKLIRASSAIRSPFLLSDQGYHKSLILILDDEEEFSNGVILNHVTDSTYPLDLGNEGIVELAIRYGGPVQESAEDEMLPLVFLHTNKELAEVELGKLVGNGIYRCTEEETISAISFGLAGSEEFMVIQGLSVWKKDGESDKGGVLGDLDEGFFESVSQIHVQDIWTTLTTQQKLSRETFKENVALAQKAWRQAGGTIAERESSTLVFGSNTDVAALADEALARWIKSFLLDE